MQKFTWVTKWKLFLLKKIAIWQTGGDWTLIPQFPAHLHTHPEPHLGPFSWAIVLRISLDSPKQLLKQKDTESPLGQRSFSIGAGLSHSHVLDFWSAFKSLLYFLVKFSPTGLKSDVEVNRLVLNQSDPSSGTESRLWTKEENMWWQLL